MSFDFLYAYSFRPSNGAMTGSASALLVDRSTNNYDGLDPLAERIRGGYRSDCDTSIKTTRERR